MYNIDPQTPEEREILRQVIKELYGFLPERLSDDEEDNHTS